MNGPEDAVATHRVLYGRRSGRKLRPGLQALLDTRLRALSVPGARRDENPERTPTDLRALFGPVADLWVEIGFGGGEHLIAQAAANRAVGLIGCEPFINGVAKLLAAIEREGLGNVRLVAGDARDLLDVLPAASVGKLFLLYPDPWPKKRHHKRRFVSHANLDAIARVLRPGAELRIATDIPDYVRHALEHLDARSEFVWTAERPGDWRRAWPGWTRTRYEAKALREGRRPHYLTFRRI